MSDRREAGFTLIELLIVIAIIALLMGLVTFAIQSAQKKSKIVQTQNDISNFRSALKSFNTDTGNYPGFSDPVDESDLESLNSFPALFTAIFYDRKNGGGPNGPYIEDVKRDRVLVFDEDASSPDKRFVRANNDEFEDSKLKKYFADAWLAPYIYRENASKPTKRPYMISRTYDLYSTGPDRLNQSADGISENKNDDIGNWQ
ncbi:MAG: prepilin-type N-terminal cleavage/methylation domain-containing protein [Planctomycetota bacterium]